jgi:hypothetical protein
MTKTTVSNTRHWDALKATDPKHTKSFSRSGGFKGTALKPIWIIEQMTKHFGPVGEGWGMGEPKFQVVDLTKDTGRVMVYCWVECWHTETGCSFWGVGGDTVQDQFRDGRMAPDDEAFKKAYTDAVNNALKFVGVGADIHMGQFEDSKYMKQVAEQFALTLPEEAELAEFIEAVSIAQTDDDLKSLLDRYKDAINKVGAVKPAEKARAVQAYQARVKAIRDAIVQTGDAE